MVLLTVIADVARAYVDLRGLQVRASVLDSAIDVLRESLRIVSIRYERGITNELDVTLATRELATLEAQQAPARGAGARRRVHHRDAARAVPGGAGAELTAPAMVPAVPEPWPRACRRSCLRRRPDIREAERELAGATARIGVATANLFPVARGHRRGRLPAPVDQGSLPVLGQHIWSAGPTALWPLLDFGALDAQVEIADLETRALLVSYKQTIQGAVREVDTRPRLYGAEQASLDKLGTALLASQRAVTLANERYQRGLTDFLNVVDAERQEYDIEEQYAATQVVAAGGFVELFRSLGGGWENYQVATADYEAVAGRGRRLPRSLHAQHGTQGSVRDTAGSVRGSAPLPFDPHGPAVVRKIADDANGCFVGR